MIRRTVISLLLPLLLLCQAGAAIVVTYRGNAPNVFGPLNPLPFATDFDINSDGIADFFFHRGSFTAAMQGHNGNRFISVISTGWDVGGNIVPIQTGSLIGPDTVSLPGNWHHHTDNGGASGFGLTNMQHADAYIGVEFRIEDEIHYGWIHYSGFDHPDNGPFLPFPGGFINSWAWETEPGVSIVAGQIPEPATVALLTGGAILGITLWVRRRRR